MVTGTAMGMVTRTAIGMVRVMIPVMVPVRATIDLTLNTADKFGASHSNTMRPTRSLIPNPNPSPSYP